MFTDDSFNLQKLLKEVKKCFDEIYEDVTINQKIQFLDTFPELKFEDQQQEDEFDFVYKQKYSRSQFGTTDELIEAYNGIICELNEPGLGRSICLRNSLVNTLKIFPVLYKKEWAKTSTNSTFTEIFFQKETVFNKDQICE